MELAKKIAVVVVRNELIHIEMGLYDANTQVGTLEAWNYNAAEKRFYSGDTPKTILSDALAAKLSSLLDDLRAEIPPE